MDRQFERRLAVMGARVRIAELQAEIDTLKEAFPEVTLELQRMRAAHARQALALKRGDDDAAADRPARKKKA